MQSYILPPIKNSDYYNSKNDNNRDTPQGYIQNNYHKNEMNNNVVLPHIDSVLSIPNAPIFNPCHIMPTNSISTVITNSHTNSFTPNPTHSLGINSLKPINQSNRLNSYSLEQQTIVEKRNNYQNEYEHSNRPNLYGSIDNKVNDYNNNSSTFRKSINNPITVANNNQGTNSYLHNYSINPISQSLGNKRDYNTFSQGNNVEKEEEHKQKKIHNNNNYNQNNMYQNQYQYQYQNKNSNNNNQNQNIIQNQNPNSSQNQSQCYNYNNNQNQSQYYNNHHHNHHSHHQNHNHNHDIKEEYQSNNKGIPSSKENSNEIFLPKLIIYLVYKIWCNSEKIYQNMKINQYISPINSPKNSVTNGVMPSHSLNLQNSNTTPINSANILSPITPSYTKHYDIVRTSGGMRNHQNHHYINSNQGNEDENDIELIILKASSSSCKGEIYNKYTKLIDYVDHLLKVTQISYPTVLLALEYIYRLKEASQYHRGNFLTQWSYEEIIPIAFMMANKYLSDDRYSNTVWANLTNISLSHLNHLEMKALMVISFRLYVSDEDYNMWISIIQMVNKSMSQRIQNLTSTTREKTINNYSFSSPISMTSSSSSSSSSTPSKSITHSHSPSLNSLMSSPVTPSHFYHHTNETSSVSAATTHKTSVYTPTMISNHYQQNTMSTTQNHQTNEPNSSIHKLIIPAQVRIQVHPQSSTNLQIQVHQPQQTQYQQTQYQQSQTQSQQPQMILQQQQPTTLINYSMSQPQPTQVNYSVSQPQPQPQPQPVQVNYTISQSQPQTSQMNYSISQPQTQPQQTTQINYPISQPQTQSQPTQINYSISQQPQPQSQPQSSMIMRNSQSNTRYIPNTQINNNNNNNNNAVNQNNSFTISIITNDGSNSSTFQSPCITNTNTNLPKPILLISQVPGSSSSTTTTPLITTTTTSTTNSHLNHSQPSSLISIQASSSSSSTATTTTNNNTRVSNFAPQQHSLPFLLNPSTHNTNIYPSPPLSRSTSPIRGNDRINSHFHPVSYHPYPSSRLNTLINPYATTKKTKLYHSS